MDIKVQSSTDYGKFKNVLGNRVINNTNLNRISRSIQKKNLTPYIPALVNEKFEIIDGQHRFQNAIHTKQPFYFIMAEGIGLPEARLLNANLKPWEINDYLESYAAEGIKDYIELKEILEEYQDVSLSVAIHLLMKGIVGSRGVNPLFKAGRFEIRHREEFLKLLDVFTDFKPHFDTQKKESFRNVQSALDRVIKAENEKELLDKVKREKAVIEIQTPVSNIMRQFDEVFNKRVRYYRHVGTRRGEE